MRKIKLDSANPDDEKLIADITLLNSLLEHLDDCEKISFIPVQEHVFAEYVQGATDTLTEKFTEESNGNPDKFDHDEFSEELADELIKNREIPFTKVFLTLSSPIQNEQIFAQLAEHINTLWETDPADESTDAPPLSGCSIKIGTNGNSLTWAGTCHRDTFAEVTANVKSAAPDLPLEQPEPEQQNVEPA